MLGTQVQSLVWKILHAKALSLKSYNYWACLPRAHALQQEKPPQREAGGLQIESSPCSLQPEGSACSIEDPAQLKIK